MWESEKLRLVFLAASRSVETHWILRDLHFIVLGYFEISLNSTTRARPDPTRQRPRTMSETRVVCLVGSGRARVVEFSYYFDGF